MGDNNEPCCPSCSGGGGYTYTLTESHAMGGAWGEGAEAGDSGIRVKQSLVECVECGARFQFRALERKGLVS